jgi:hypothetical protein
MIRHRLSKHQQQEVLTWQRYLDAAEADYKDYGHRQDLVGRAVKDIRDRFARLVLRAKHGRPTPY